MLMLKFLIISKLKKQSIMWKITIFFYWHTLFFFLNVDNWTKSKYLQTAFSSVHIFVNFQFVFHTCSTYTAYIHFLWVYLFTHKLVCGRLRKYIWNFLRKFCFNLIRLIECSLNLKSACKFSLKKALKKIFNICKSF